MRYSSDFRNRAIAVAKSTGNQSETARLFGISRQTLHDWLREEAIPPSQYWTRRRKIDRAALVAHVRAYPDALLRERAAHFGVSHQSLWMMLKKLKITKKNDEVSGSELR
jgi:transposase